MAVVFKGKAYQPGSKRVEGWTHRVLGGPRGSSGRPTASQGVKV